ncbi:MAG: diguanylate cyclase [Nitrospirae bacterium]|nr:diguanylate cyclase [Nitrospirota bacterium]
MKNTVTDNLRTIERKESHLWFITLGLLMLYAGILIATYYVIVSESYLGSGGLEPTIYKALGGLSILTVLFSIYVLHSRNLFKRVKKIFEIHAMRDSLTGLYNRYYFDERIKEEILRANRNREALAILLCDIDKFKAINDNYGHQVGDEVLRKVSEGIKEATRGIDLVCRWGGDEMVVVLSNVTREGIMTATDRIRNRIVNIGEKNNLPLDISIGVALYPEHGQNIDELIRMADRALYIAKKGGDKIHVGEEEYPLDASAINIVFQPILDTRSQQILGYEALSRDPQGKLEILELFKRYQAVGQLKELKSLCFSLQLKKAEELGLKKVFINIDFDVLNNMKTIPMLRATEVILEISESEALHDIERFLEIAKKWRARGFKFAIDDFGAGFISLPFVARLLPDYIKLDRSTIVQAVASEQFGKFLKDLVLAFKNYSKEGIIAEGIETEKELQIAKETGNYLVQGMLLGEPKEME